MDTSNSNDKKNIERLAAEFLERWHQTALPAMDAVDMLDLADYFSDKGMDFEAELCHYIANRVYPNDPEVMLAQAHTQAEQGDWLASANTRNQAGISGYDEKLFRVEQMVRSFQYDKAMNVLLHVLPPEEERELPEYDFIFDTGCLFYDNGYNEQAIQAFSMLPPTYVDYQSAQLHIVDAQAFLGHYDEAKQLLNSMIDHDAFNAELWERMANYNYLARNYYEMTEASNYATTINPNSPASRYRNLVATRQRALKDDTGAFFDELKANQESGYLMEYADTLYEAGRYDVAMGAYAWASLFCPTGDNIRIYLQSHYLLCLAHCEEPEKAFTLLQSLTTFYGEYWDIIFEAAQITFEFGHVEWALRMLDIARNKHYIHGARYNQLAALLAHYECYKPASKFWNDMLNHVSLLSPSFKHYTEQASGQIDHEL